ncbi:dTDP-4-dehydrorhamnose 3,5-epimerase [Afipia carboxidovorans OM5]|uniref:dTDP-4-dehydrorhamnose 3,5-epimerase n=1 Tax=Afipia carboxidovorans (strain ATCC 49405 / DSM 1227 / KCTC 32145 / OM5) TaxID=504832 RepID=B6JCW5_AFIC5|nr:dTDP-4-dehydrorhamnose 3,5-epimerase [Afipia carboxidovorans]ACI91695.1 dTDP-4-dehydrorhamnose 3,5-epimerase [Afipia carboxidovorans OM5]AEI04436.1 dTDP-4-dehydrorhamnose 3,5-epimerase RfbC [Afipia carboxidovorans OM4]AEI08066.1 dTDP-4-dehydrorhamnose 3,5-epimerase RfbC [Afipia carboxidovorans OM5]
MTAAAATLDGVVVIEPQVFTDARGYFFESFNAERFRERVARDVTFVQDNQSLSRKGVVRGLHYQIAPKAQGKLVRALAGEIFDVAVDIRKGSKQFGQWFGTILSAENKKQLWVPEGYAHGFQVLSETAEVLYKTTDFWSAAHERAIRWDDPTLAIDWPLKEGCIVSGKDGEAPLLADATLF